MVVFNGLVWLFSSRLSQILVVPILLGVIRGVRCVFSLAAIGHFRGGFYSQLALLLLTPLHLNHLARLVGEPV